MTSSSFHLRGISPQVMAILKREAKNHNISVNVLILKLIEQGIGISGKPKKTIHHDLDFLIGTWSSKELGEFNKRIKIFEKIDDELWK